MGLDSSPTPFATAPGAPVAMGPNWLAYLADEATSGNADLNGDGDALDRVGVAFDLRARRATTLRAAHGVWLLGDELFLSTREDEDDRDWDADGSKDDLVLLHWSAASGVAFVAKLADAAPVAVGTHLYFSDGDDTLPLAPGETRLEWVAADAPTTPVRVLAAGTVFGVDPRPLAQDEGLLFLLQDERADASDLNGDGDALDSCVLALLDALDPAAPVRNVALAVLACAGLV